MKNALELYEYLYKNLHTQAWIATRKREVMLCLRDEVPRCNGSYYSSRRIRYDYTNELWLILKCKCNEPAYKEDVFHSVNMLFQDIADELTEALPTLSSYRVILHARDYDEAVLWIGPSQYAERFLNIFLQSGYDAALASLK